jgi:uncharacterized membrane protein
MKEAKKSGDFYFDDAAVIRSDDKGKVHISETGDMSTGKGALIGGVVVGVLSLLGGPAVLAAPALAGAGMGAIAALKDSGFDNDSLKEIGAALPPGTSAIAAEEVRKTSEQGETLTFARDIAGDISAHLGARQDVLYTLVLTEEGIGVAKVVSSPTMLAVFGIVATAE